MSDDDSRLGTTAWSPWNWILVVTVRAHVRRPEDTRIPHQGRVDDENTEEHPTDSEYSVYRKPLGCT